MMKQVKCPFCRESCVKCGKTAAGSQRWKCKKCSNVFTVKIDNSAKQLNIFLKWLFSRSTQKILPGEGRTFRRKTSVFWEIWPMPSLVEEQRDVLYLDGIYLGRKACVLICCDDQHVLGWYVCRNEHAGAWTALMKRIAEPKFVVSDGGTGFKKALRKTWPNARNQRCVFHIFSQIKRYTTSRPKTLAGIELYALAKELMHVESKDEAERWIDQFVGWSSKHNRFLSQRTYDEFGNSRPTHERLLKAQQSIKRLIREGTMFTYLDEELQEELRKVPSTNNRIEGGVNARLRELLRNHRGLSIERRMKAVFWWCYMHSPEPLPAAELLRVMPTDKSIAMIYEKMNRKNAPERSIPTWGDAVAWRELHRSVEYRVDWD